jgi:hypothetical protein
MRGRERGKRRELRELRGVPEGGAQVQARPAEGRDDDLCFGSGGGSKIGIFIGLMIILAGVSELLQGTFWWATWDNLWPIPVILLGLFIVYNALSKR